ncbi:MAG TPA: VWA domain-containing protein [Terriglobales bacterium]|nr:VWA domain-containing protein [Terriglobales bacterium]
MHRVFGYLFVTIALIGTCTAQQAVTFLRLGFNIVQGKASLRPATPDERLTTLRSLFKTAGCQPTQMLEQPVPGSIPDLSCTSRGTSDWMIVVLAPSDYGSKGDEAGLQWGDLAMLPILAESIGSVLTRHQFVFLAVSGSKDQNGAKLFLERLSTEQRKKVHAVIALDHIGRTTLQYSVPGTESGIDLRTERIGGLSRRSSGAQVSVNELWNPSYLPITQSIPAAAARWKLPIPEKNDEFGSKETKPFRAEEIPSLTFSSPAWVITGRIGDQALRDYRTKIDFKAYNDTYLFLCAYLLFLDRDLGKTLPAPGPDTVVASASSPAAPLQSDPVASVEVHAPLISAATPDALAEPATAAQPDTTPTFRVTTRLVQVDVVATDKTGHPITGLRKEDFTLLQDGHPQNTRVFEEHTSDVTPANTQPDETKPHVLGATYSNEPDTRSAQSRTILLFDMLNTPPQDQQLARNQLKKLAKALPPGQPVAFFVLTSRLVMVQSFTSDPKGLQQAIDHIHSQQSPLLTTEAERQQAIGDVVYRAMQSSAGSSDNPSGASSMMEDQLGRLLSMYKTTEGMRTDERVTFTMDALSAMARSVAGYPGRKNLVWLAGSFPISLAPDQTLKENQFRNGRNYLNALSQTAALLAQSRVAVYPVDIRGMQLRGIDISTSTPESAAYVTGTSTLSGSATTAPDKTGSLLNEQSSISADERDSMMTVAEQTGGRAFVNTNDFGTAITRAMDDGSHYYTLAYSPTTEDEPATFHRIELKIDRPDVKLSYRRGYYTQPKPATSQAGLAALQGALQPGMPPATMLYFTATPKLPAASNQSVHLSYSVNANGLTFEDTTAHDGKHVVADFMVIAFDKDGKEVAHASDTLDGTIPNSLYESTLRSGIPASQEIALKPGVYNLRIGVQDRVSQRIGTLDVPLTVP